MQKLFNSSPFDQDVEKATSEMNTAEDWSTILKICDLVNSKTHPNGARDCVRSILKRLNSNVPHHAMHALTLLDACILNCDRSVHREVCSKMCEIELKKVLNKGHPKVIDKLMSLLKKWTETVFQNDPELSLIPALYNSYKEKNLPCTDTVVKQKDSTVISNKEDEDLAKAISLSLKEISNSHTSPQSGNSLYPSVSNTHTAVAKEARKVRALYDFEAAEDNELSFKTGDIILVLDDSDRNWWKGVCHHKEGLFPANFVTADLTLAEPEVIKPVKSVKFNEEVNVQHTVEVEHEEIQIDENKIDKMLMLLHVADPTGEKADSEELVTLEENCLRMTPIIDQELEQIDRQHASLTAANKRLVEAMCYYQMLMKDSVCTPYNTFPGQEIMYSTPVPQHQEVFYQDFVYGTPVSATYSPLTAEHYSAPAPPPV